MYADPALIRDNVVKVRLSDPEAALVDALVNYTGQQKAAFIRDLILEAAERALFAVNNGDGASELQGPSTSRKVA